MQQRKQRKLREPAEVSKYLEALMLEKVEQVLKGEESWQTLEECTRWIKQHCTAVPGEEENKALTAVLALIASSLAISSCKEFWRASVRTQSMAFLALPRLA